MTNPLFKPPKTRTLTLAERWLPIEDMAFWREFQRRWPPAAETVWNRAYDALFKPRIQK